MLDHCLLISKSRGRSKAKGPKRRKVGCQISCGGGGGGLALATGGGARAPGGASKGVPTLDPARLGPTRLGIFLILFLMFNFLIFWYLLFIIAHMYSYCYFCY